MSKKLFHWLPDQIREKHIQELVDAGCMAIKVAACYANLTGQYSSMPAWSENGQVVKIILASDYLEVKKIIENRPSGKIQLVELI